MTEGQHLGPKLGVRAEADEDEVSEESDERIGEGEDHGAGPCRLAPVICAEDGWATSRGPGLGVESSFSRRFYRANCGIPGRPRAST